MLFERAHDVRDRGHLLTDRNIDAFNAATLLIDNGIDRYSGFANLAVADD